MKLEDLDLRTFSDRLGDAFALSAGERTLELTLQTATVAASAGDARARTPFSIVFAGPADPLLAQSIYRLEHAELGALEIFIVPIGRDEHGTRYEAVFG